MQLIIMQLRIVVSEATRASLVGERERVKSFRFFKSKIQVLTSIKKTINNNNFKVIGAYRYKNIYIVVGVP